MKLDNDASVKEFLEELDYLIKYYDLYLTGEKLLKKHGGKNTLNITEIEKSLNVLKLTYKQISEMNK